MTEPREVASHIDADELEAVLEEVKQGDLLDIGKITFLWSPDAPSHGSEVEGVEHEEPAMTDEMRLRSGLCAVVSQDCDLRRLPDVEPYVLLSPLSEVDETTYREAADGMSVRFFAYPEIEGHEGQLALDARMIQSLEKTALLSRRIERIDCPLSEPTRVTLRAWLGRRLGRDAFPDEIVCSVIKPIEQAVKKARKKDIEGVFPTVSWVGLRWTPGKMYCSLLLLTDPVLCAQHGVGSTQIDLMKGRLNKALTQFAAKAGDYNVIANLHSAADVSAASLLEFYELSLDLDL